MILGKIVPALDAVDISDLDSAEASTADGRHLELTLRAEMKTGGDLRAAVWTSLLDRLAKKKVDDSADAAGH